MHIDVKTILSKMFTFAPQQKRIIVFISASSNKFETYVYGCVHTFAICWYLHIYKQMSWKVTWKTKCGSVYGLPSKNSL